MTAKEPNSQLSNRSNVSDPAMIIFMLLGVRNGKLGSSSCMVRRKSLITASGLPIVFTTKLMAGITCKRISEEI